eukprot:m.266864 g.266864  ORF g.266864 m.266864 type:complete len:507 (-) comp19280_c2_seq7:3351-4871(-)
MLEETYDEDLTDNVFFKMLTTKYKRLYNKAATSRYVICVPRAPSIGGVFSRDDVEAHILMPTAEPAVFKTANKKSVHLEGMQITTGTGFKEQRKSRIMFEESFYNSRDESYRVLCIEIPLQGEVSLEQRLEPLLTFSDCKTFLWADLANLKCQKRIVETVNVFNSTFQCLETESLGHIVDAAATVYTRGMQYVLKDSTYRKLARASKPIMDRVKLAMETFVMHGLYPNVFPGLCSFLSQQDARLNKITRNLSRVQEDQLELSPELSANVPPAVQVGDVASTLPPVPPLTCRFFAVHKKEMALATTKCTPQETPFLFARSLRTQTLSELPCVYNGFRPHVGGASGVSLNLPTPTGAIIVTCHTRMATILVRLHVLVLSTTTLVHTHPVYRAAQWRHHTAGKTSLFARGHPQSHNPRVARCVSRRPHSTFASCCHSCARAQLERQPALHATVSIFCCLLGRVCVPLDDLGGSSHAHPGRQPCRDYKLESGDGFVTRKGEAKFGTQQRH